jgi:NAD(P)-dependent dehydrogenase (short-subunit alcohol dehydrogenase family)
MGKLSGKVAIVTGAASGIGRAAVQRFIEEGATVIGADISEIDGITLADAGKEDDIKALVDKAVNEYGGLDIFFANAGISGGIRPILEDTVETWEETLRVNLIGPFLAIKHAAPELKKRGGGSIICTASAAGIRASAGGTAYSASKAGVMNLVQVSANQLVGSNIRVNAIAPGLIETGMTAPIFSNARERGKENKIGQLNPLKRAGRAEEVAGAALYLASDDASYVNGQTLIVDGGLSSTHPFARQAYGQLSL